MYSNAIHDVLSQGRDNDAFSKNSSILFDTLYAFAFLVLNLMNLEFNMFSKWIPYNGLQ